MFYPGPKEKAVPKSRFLSTGGPAAARRRDSIGGIGGCVLVHTRAIRPKGPLRRLWLLVTPNPPPYRLPPTPSSTTHPLSTRSSPPAA